VTTRDNVALARRVDDLERAVLSTELVLISTHLVVCVRGDEPRLRTVAEVLDEARHEPTPRVIERRPDLQLLLHPPTATRILRHQLDDAGQAEFDELAATARLIDVEITCHPKQLEAILNPSPLKAVFGGNRSGKSYVMGWWLFRRWMLRGRYGGLFWWVAPTAPHAHKYGLCLLSGPDGLGGGQWPDEVFASLSRVSKDSPAPYRRTLIDGSLVEFHHANYSGRQAGSNLRAANVLDAAVDELTAILDQTNWQQVHARVSQSGGNIFTATTRRSGHWSEDEIEDVQTNAAGAVWSTSVDILDNPWMTFARCWQLFLTDGTLDARKLEQQVLPAADPAAKCRQIVTRPASLREHFGVKTIEGIVLWSNWTGEQIIDDDRFAREWLTWAGKRLPNITAAVLASKWRGPTPDYLLGQDFNVSPMVAVAMQIFGDYARPETWVALAFDEIATEGTVQKHARELKRRGYGGAAIYCDPTGAMSGHEARGSAGSTDALALKREGFRVKPANGASASGVAHLSFIDSAGVMHQLHDEGRAVVHARCAGLLDALKHDRAKADGTRDKVSGTGSISDKRSAYTDAKRYPIWPIFKHAITPKARIRT
jgi:hypothetical protein